MDFLLSLGANPNAQTNDGTSCLTVCTISYLERFPNETRKLNHWLEMKGEVTFTGIWHGAELNWLLNCRRQQSNTSTECDHLGEFAENQISDEGEFL